MEAESVNRHLMRSMSTVVRCANLYRDQFLQGTGMSGAQLPYVLQICGSPGISQDQIAQRLHVNRSSVTRQLGLLEENGFITRRRCESDQRVIEVAPTDAMLKLLPLVRDIFARWRAVLAAGLSEAELNTLAGLLARVVANAEGAV